jgi:hypothetical protein
MSDVRQLLGEEETVDPTKLTTAHVAAYRYVEPVAVRFIATEPRLPEDVIRRIPGAQVGDGLERVGPVYRYAAIYKDAALRIVQNRHAIGGWRIYDDFYLYDDDHRGRHPYGTFNLVHGPSSGTDCKDEQEAREALSILAGDRKDIKAIARRRLGEDVDEKNFARSLKSALGCELVCVRYLGTTTAQEVWEFSARDDKLHLREVVGEVLSRYMFLSVSKTGINDAIIPAFNLLDDLVTWTGFAGRPHFGYLTHEVCGRFYDRAQALEAFAIRSGDKKLIKSAMRKRLGEAVELLTPRLLDKSMGNEVGSTLRLKYTGQVGPVKATIFGHGRWLNIADAQRYTVLMKLGSTGYHVYDDIVAWRGYDGLPHVGFLNTDLWTTEDLTSAEEEFAIRCGDRNLVKAAARRRLGS